MSASWVWSGSAWGSLSGCFCGVPFVISFPSFVTFLMKPGGANVCCLVLLVSGLFSLYQKVLKTRRNSFPSARSVYRLCSGPVCLQITDEAVMSGFWWAAWTRQTSRVCFDTRSNCTWMFQVLRWWLTWWFKMFYKYAVFTFSLELKHAE